MRIQAQPAFVLHARPYRETSLVLEVFTRDHGRLGLVGRGVRNPKARMRAVLLPFQPIVVGWNGKGELPLLTAAEQVGPARELTGQRRYAGFYLNELIIRLLHRHDPHELLFDHYAEALGRLQDRDEIPAVLRRFETRLLSETGYGLVLEHEAGSLQPLRADERYRYIPERGPEPDQGDSHHGIAVHGRSLLDLFSGEFASPRTLHEAQRLIRHLLERQLAGRALHSRTVFHQVLSRLSD